MWLSVGDNWLVSNCQRRRRKHLLERDFGDWDYGDEDDDADGQESRIPLCRQDIGRDLVQDGVTKHKPADDCHRGVKRELAVLEQ